ncbi:MAG: type II secretion system protein GspD, partial [Candidatus Zixiibacteriota bacterium]
GEFASKLMTLKYINPNTAVKALETRISEKGQITVLDKNLQDSQSSTDKFQPNRILITERAGLLEELARLVKEIDVPERMIQIEAKIIETKLDKNSKLGFLWPSSVTGSLSNADGWTTSTDDEEGTTSNTIAGFHDIENESWTWGKVSVQQLDMVLDFLKQDDNTKLISDPHITTLENHEAEIKIETIVPIQTINRFSEGAVIQDIVTFQDEEIGISLKVTPRINEAGLITLEVNPVVEDIIGYAGSDDNRKPITSSRSIKTRITVNDGESIALGGLLKEDEIKSEQKLPLLGYIPILGKLLFTHTTTEKAKTDLIILITPRIL